MTNWKIFSWYVYQNWFDTHCFFLPTSISHFWSGLIIHPFLWKTASPPLWQCVYLGGFSPWVLWSQGCWPSPGQSQPSLLLRHKKAHGLSHVQNQENVRVSVISKVRLRSWVWIDWRYRAQNLALCSEFINWGSHKSGMVSDNTFLHIFSSYERN